MRPFFKLLVSRTNKNLDRGGALFWIDYEVYLAIRCTFQAAKCAKFLQTSGIFWAQHGNIMQNNPFFNILHAATHA
jgi:hypothetical protein